MYSEDGPSPCVGCCWGATNHGPPFRLYRVDYCVSKLMTVLSTLSSFRSHEDPGFVLWSDPQRDPLRDFHGDSHRRVEGKTLLSTRKWTEGCSRRRASPVLKQTQQGTARRRDPCRGLQSPHTVYHDLRLGDASDTDHYRG